MFKCTVCNTEYKIKPDYCECGNDTFSEITEQTEPQNQKRLPVKNFLSIFIFALCILLSATIISIKPENKQPQMKKTEKPGITNIPDIETIWNSTPPEIISSTQNIITVYEKPIKKTTQKPERLPIQKKIKQEKLKQSAPNKIIAKPEPKKVKKTTQAQNKPSPEQPSQSEKKPQQQTQPQQTQQKQHTSQPVKQVTKPAPQPIKTMNSQEWDKYKNSLRYALLSKLDIVKITGEGDCAIEFSFDQNGKLLNRKFIYKSQNKTVNDEVYLMLMKLPIYKTPPSGYNGEKIKMKFYINNGYYEISFL